MSEREQMSRKREHVSMPSVFDFRLLTSKGSYLDSANGIALHRADCLKLMGGLVEQFPDGIFDMIFADPPYFLSNGGITCKAGRMVSVNKGAWDKPKGVENNHAFNTEWLSLCQQLLRQNGTIWVTGTHHVIFSVGFAMQQLGFKILNDITWEKPNPPPNLSCRYFTHSTETVVWAAKSAKSKHVFNYDAMRQEAGGKQMKTVWRRDTLAYDQNEESFIWKYTAPSKGEKTFGKHPTQKPVRLVERCILASTQPDDLVLDPFAGIATTGIASMKTHRKCVLVEKDAGFFKLAKNRLTNETRQKLLDPSSQPTPART